jgi:hypothetical protein
MAMGRAPRGRRSAGRVATRTSGHALRAGGPRGEAPRPPRGGIAAGRRGLSAQFLVVIGAVGLLFAACSKVDESAPADSRFAGRSTTTVTAPPGTRGSTSQPSAPATSTPTTSGPSTSPPGTSGPAGPTSTPPTSAPGSPATTSPTQPPTSQPPATSPPPAGGETPFPGGRAPVQSGFPGTNHLAVLQDVRVGQHPGFDRVVFEFRSGDALPGYQVAYRDGTTVPADASGAPVHVSGDRALVVQMHAASRADLTQTPVVPGYRGPDRVSGGDASVTEVALVGDFEATLSWAIGVRDYPSFSVSSLTDPTRLVIDVEVGGRG